MRLLETLRTKLSVHETFRTDADIRVEEMSVNKNSQKNTVGLIRKEKTYPVIFIKSSVAL